MSVKHFCDACGTELSDLLNWAERWSPSLNMHGDKYTVESTYVKRSSGARADLCRACMFKLVTEGKFS